MSRSITKVRPTAEIKSAIVITDRAEIARRMLEREHSSPSRPEAGSFVEDSEHGARGYKYRPTAMRQMVLTNTALQAMCTERGIPWRAEYAERAIPYWASDERVDGHGDIVRQDWIFDEFEDNPLMPYSHEWENPPIGAYLSWSVETRSDAKYEGPALALLGLFATADQYDWADTIFRLVKAGFLTASSVGFYPERVVWVEDDQERLGLGLGNHGYILEGNHLLEHSPTSLGANAGAGVMRNRLERASRAGLIRASDATALREIRRRELRGSPDAWAQADRELRTLLRLSFPSLELPPHEDAEEPFVASQGGRERNPFAVAVRAAEEPPPQADGGAGAGEAAEATQEPQDGADEGMGAEAAPAAGSATGGQGGGQEATGEPPHETLPDEGGSGEEGGAGGQPPSDPPEEEGLEVPPEEDCSEEDSTPAELARALRRMRVSFEQGLVSLSATLFDALDEIAAISEAVEGIRRSIDQDQEEHDEPELPEVDGRVDRVLSVLEGAVTRKQGA